MHNPFLQHQFRIIDGLNFKMEKLELALLEYVPISKRVVPFLLPGLLIVVCLVFFLGEQVTMG